LVPYIQELDDDIRYRAVKPETGRGDAVRQVLEAFAMIEELAESTDPKTQFLCETTMEGLVHSSSDLERFACYMGPKTREVVRRVCEGTRINTRALDVPSPYRWKSAPSSRKRSRHGRDRRPAPPWPEEGSG
jgi:hypothetical protein